MVESISLYIGIVLSLAVITSMMFNPRRLEAPGYSLSVLLLQVLMAGHEDVFFLCPQFPIYVSPLDANLDPDITTSDSRARGVLVDTALLLARSTGPRIDTGTDSIGRAFDKAHQARDFNLFGKLDIISLNAPILEERKRGPTRHPKDLEEYVQSINEALAEAQEQVVTQARILFSSPRFADQDLVILLATSGEYYSIAVLKRDHPAVVKMPRPDEVQRVIEAKEGLGVDLEDNSTRLLEELIDPSVIKEQKQNIERERQEQEKLQKDRERAARLEARTARKIALAELAKGTQEESLFQLVFEAGSPPYTDQMIEACYKLSDFPSRHNRRYLRFFEPVPTPKEEINSLADLRHPKQKVRVLFTSVIRVGSDASDGFVEMIRDYLAGLANDERARRA